MARILHQQLTTGDERCELDRIREVYAGRRAANITQRYSRMNPGHLYALQEREATMAMLLDSAGVVSLAGLRILDVGCGTGAALRQYLEYQADPSLLWGIDLLPSLLQKATSGSPHLQLVCGSASELPFPDHSFDVVSQFMLFTSVLSRDLKRQIAAEINRVLVPGGKFLWYDFGFDNPANKNVRGVRLAEVRELFPGFAISARRITLLPPLGRRIGRFGPAIYSIVSSIRLLCTHYFCLLEKQ